MLYVRLQEFTIQFSVPELEDCKLEDLETLGLHMW
jgi:hypothetical protein